MDWLEAINFELGAAFDMLEVAIKNANEDVWNKADENHSFWSIAYHTIFFCDFYFSDFDPNIANVEEQYSLPEYMKPWAKSYDFQLEDDTVPSKDILLRFLDEIRSKLRERFKTVVKTEVDYMATSWEPEESMPRGTMMLYVMRHIMQHVGQLNMILRKHGLKTSEWQTLTSI